MRKDPKDSGLWQTDEIRDVLTSVLVTLQQISEARGIDLMTAKKVYDAFGADGASRLAENEALTERVRLLEEALELAKELDGRWTDLHIKEWLPDGVQEIRLRFWAALKALEQPPVDPMKGE